MIFEDAQRFLGCICLAIFLGVPASASLAEELNVGSCPSNNVVQRLGEWSTLSNDVRLVETLRSNPNRSNDVAAAYVTDDASLLEVVVLSLRGLERFQGNISVSDFNALRGEFAEAFRGPTPEMQRKIDAVIEGNLTGTDATVSHLRYQPVTLSPGKLVGYAIVETSVPGTSLTLFETAMKMQHIRGCIVQANFSIAISPGSRDRLEQAISDFVMQ